LDVLQAETKWKSDIPEAELNKQIVLLEKQKSLIDLAIKNPVDIRNIDLLDELLRKRDSISENISRIKSNILISSINKQANPDNKPKEKEPDVKFTHNNETKEFIAKGEEILKKKDELIKAKIELQQELDNNERGGKLDVNKSIELMKKQNKLE
jgi:hypothetical protein